MPKGRVSEPKSSAGPGAPSVSLVSDDGAFVFTLQRRPQGVLVRVQLRKGAARIVHSVLFADNSSFHRWCDADSVRFAHPLIYVGLKRDGDVLFRRND